MKILNLFKRKKEDPIRELYRKGIKSALETYGPIKYGEINELKIPKKVLKPAVQTLKEILIEPKDIDEIWKIPNRELRMLLDNLYCKKVVLAEIKSFKYGDWTQTTKRLRSEIGNILASLEPDEKAIWDKIWKKKLATKKWQKELKNSLSS